VDEFGMCYCGLFVSKVVKDDPSKLQPIPERRPKEIVDEVMKVKMGKVKPVDGPSYASAMKGEGASGIPVWRCKVCGYLAAREHPPAVCPICKAKRERFERFSFG
jgi:rubrerythrin